MCQALGTGSKRCLSPVEWPLLVQKTINTHTKRVTSKPGELSTAARRTHHGESRREGRERGTTPFRQQTPREVTPELRPERVPARGGQGKDTGGQGNSTGQRL